MGAGVNQAVFGHIHRPGQNIRGHIAHQRDLAGLRDVLPLCSENSVVGAVVEIPGLRVQNQVLLAGDVGMVFVRRGGGNIHSPVLFGFFRGDFRKITGNGIVRLSALPHQVQGDHGELAGGPGLEEEELVPRRDGQNPAQLVLGLVKDLLENGGAVAHLHDRHAGTPVVGDLRPGPLQGGQGEHGGSGGKVVDTFRHGGQPLSQM